MKLNLINIVAGDREVIISFDYFRNKFEIATMDIRTLELNIVER